jgi:hypothetical protein
MWKTRVCKQMESYVKDTAESQSYPYPTRH